MKFAMTVSVLDCTGCGSCANVCPGKKGNKALDYGSPGSPSSRAAESLRIMVSRSDEKPEVAEKFKETTVKGSQFKQPLLEFSGACAGCGETPYAKLVTQLFGDRMYIANATGCSSIWGGSAPSTPYTVNKEGNGPAWANSLFEDNAEYGYGMYLAQDHHAAKLQSRKSRRLAKTAKSDDEESCLREISGYRERRRSQQVRNRRADCRSWRNSGLPMTARRFSQTKIS